LNIPNTRGETPLHAAASRDNLSVVKFLLEKGAKKDVRDNGNKLPMD
jgi:ankyrin repeat protein